MQVSDGTRVRATKAMADSLSDLVRTVWEKMRLAGEAGSLLKIEEELQDAIRKGQDEWEERLPLFRITEYGLEDKPKESLVRFLPGEGLSFWDKAENLVRRALDQFVEFASNEGRLHRRLFVEDAKQGLGFVDLCRLRYDVLLMNPPFGESSKPAKNYTGTAYVRSKRDVSASFVERGIGITIKGGMLGAITSRTGFFITSFQQWREDVLLKEASPTAFADLGYGVLDTALVGTSAFCLKARDKNESSLFVQLLSSEDKQFTLCNAIKRINKATNDSKCFVIHPASLRKVPGSPFAYWIHELVRNIFTTFAAFEGSGRYACTTNPAGDNRRYFRCWWEVESHMIGRFIRWAPLSTVVSLKNSTINEQKNTISKSLNLLDAGHLPSGSYRGG